tara:strand:+ start:17171 stop:18946 length:1776 start_codon:yes stop_codon:yes gene_type:complete
MADFTLAQIGGAPTSAQQPQQAVQQPSGAVAALDFVQDIGTSLFESFAENRQEKKVEQANEAVSRFSRQQLEIAQAVDRGDMTSQQARMRMRANYASAIANNPNLTTDYAKAHSTILGTAGLGKVAAEGTEQEQQFMAVQSEATMKGWVTSGMSAEDAQDATYAYMQFQREQQMIDAEQNQLGLQRARIGLEADRVGLASARVGLGTAQINQQRAQISLQEDRARIRSQEASGSMADAAATRLRTKFNTIQQQVEAGSLDPVEATQMMDEEWLVIQSEVSRIGQGAGSEYVNNLVAPLRDFYQVKRGYVTGETDAETMEAVAANALARQTVNITGDPETARIIATSQLVGAAGNLSLQGPLNRIALDQVDRNSNPQARPADLTDPTNEAATGSYLNMLKEGMGSDREDVQQEVQTNINQVLRGLGSYGSMVENPRELNQVADFLAGDQYGSWVSQNGTAINAENAAAAREVVQVQFDEVVRPLIAEEWRNASQLTYAVPDPARPETAGQTESVTSSIRPFFTGNGVRFVPADSVQMNPRLRAKINDLNRTVAPVVNRLVRMGAHLEGTRDYQRIYESNYAGLFGDAGTGQE